MATVTSVSAPLHDVLRLRARDQLRLAQDGNDGHAGPGPERGVGERLADPGARVRDRYPLDLELAERHLEVLDDRDVDHAPEHRVTAAAGEPAERELQPQEEEQEDDPELRDEVGHLRRLDHRELLGLVRAEQQTGEQVGGDRREPEAARRQPEHGQHADRDRELGEGHSRGSSCSARSPAWPNFSTTT